MNTVGLRQRLLPIPERVKKYKTGENIFERGDVGIEAYVVLEGEVGVFVRDPKTSSDEETLLVNKLTAGDKFGDLALLRHNRQRTATCRAIADTVLKVSNCTREERPQFSGTVSVDEVCFEPGEYITKQGEVGDAFYVITSGVSIACTTVRFLSNNFIRLYKSQFAT